MLKELGIGLGFAILIILAIQGVNILPLVFLGFLSFFMFQIFSQNISRGNFNKGDLSDNESIPGVNFSDIGGQKTAKNELIESLDFIKNVEGIKKMGIRPIKGLLLSGPPGTGKTLLAKAAARYTNSVFKATSGSEFIEMYAGLGAKRVRELFRSARSTAKKINKNSAIVFIDEIDILGGKRGQVTSHLEYDQTLNQLLVEMDGLSVDDKVQVLVMATTNRIDILDQALLRPGRFDRIVQVDLPAKNDRVNILRIHTANKPLDIDADLKEIARETFGFSGAHLENLANEAAILALRDSSATIKQKYFIDALEKVMMGEKIDRKPAKDEIKRIAIHESGHALISELLKPGSVSNITITSRGKALGYVRQKPQEDKYLQTEDYLKDQIAVSIAGAVAENIVLKTRSTGAVNDFEKSIELVKQMVYSGMTDLGVVEFDSVPKTLLHGEMSKIISKIEANVERLIKENINILRNVVSVLEKTEKFSGDKLRKLLNEESIYSIS